MVQRALRAGEHGVVVSDDETASAIGRKAVAVDAAEAGHDAIGGRIADQVVARPARRLRGDRKRAIFEEAARVDQRGDVLARRAMVGLAAPGDGVRPARVLAEGLPLQHLGQVRTDRVEVARRLFGLVLAADLGRLEEDDRVALVDRVSFPCARPAHDAAARRGDEVLHLHRFEDGDLLARADAIAVRNIDRDDGPLQRR